MAHNNIYPVPFRSTKAKDMAVRGLVDLKHLFEMRVNEASEAGDIANALSAQIDLEIVEDALAAFANVADD